MALYIVSERNTNNHVAWGTSYELEDILVNDCGGVLVSPNKFKISDNFVAERFTQKIIGIHLIVN